MLNLFRAYCACITEDRQCPAWIRLRENLSSRLQRSVFKLFVNKVRHTWSDQAVYQCNHTILSSLTFTVLWLLLASTCFVDVFFLARFLSQKDRPVGWHPYRFIRMPIVYLTLVRSSRSVTCFEITWKENWQWTINVLMSWWVYVAVVAEWHVTLLYLCKDLICVNLGFRGLRGRGATDTCFR